MSASSYPAFSHTPLPDAHSIRLLCRAGISPEGIPCFTLHTRNLEAEGLRYHCISYTWGNPFAHGVPFRAHYDAVHDTYGLDRAVPILIDGKELLIHKNLYDALTTVPETAYQDDLNRKTRDRGQPYLHYVAQGGMPDHAAMYISRGAKVDAVDDSGRTALHWSVFKGHFDCTRVLCQAGATRGAKDGLGMTALEVARLAGHDDLVSYLEDLESLPDPLESIILPEEEHAGQFIWADAICINQKDLEEKGRQVSMMDHIFSLAVYTVAWLGPEDSQTDSALETLEILSSNLQQFQNSQIAPYSGLDKENYEAAGIKHISREYWEALASIYQRQWFRRVWIVQEAVLAPILVMYVGKRLVSWFDIGALSEALRRQEATLGTTRSTSFSPLTDAAVPVEWNMAELFKWRSNISMTVGRDESTMKGYADLFMLESLVGCFWTFGASEKRDKIFALHGLLNRFAIDRFLADYRQPLESVYISATRQILGDTGTLQVLAHCVSSVDRLPGLPSWVPDYSLPAVNVIPETFNADKGLELDISDPRMNIHAAKLAIKGLRIGKVTRVCGRQSTAPMAKFIFDPRWFELLLSLKEPEPEPETEAAHTRQPISEILWRTLCLDMAYGSFIDPTKHTGTAPEEFRGQFYMFMLYMILAGADRNMLEKNGLESHKDRGVTLLDSSYDPFTEDFAPIMASLDAIIARDGGHRCVPSREEIMKYWTDLRFTLIRTTAGSRDGEAVDFEVPEDVVEGKRRCVGSGIVMTDSAGFRPCLAFATAYTVAFGWRQLFTVDDQYLGVAPLSAQTGDEVWILPGLKSPAVLRPNGNNDASEFTFVGSSYVHGMMHGQGVQIAHDNGAVVETISLV